MLNNYISRREDRKANSIGSVMMRNGLCTGSEISNRVLNHKGTGHLLQIFLLLTLDICRGYCWGTEWASTKLFLKIYLCHKLKSIFAIVRQWKPTLYITISYICIIPEMKTPEWYMTPITSEKNPSN